MTLKNDSSLRLNRNLNPSGESLYDSPMLSRGLESNCINEVKGFKEVSSQCT